MMKRLITNKLLKWKTGATRKPLILRGVRQVGKTFALKKLGETEFPTYHYFNFEKETNLHKVFVSDLDPERIIQELSLASGTKINKKQDLIIFDEIQACPRALTSLKYFNEEQTETAICCAGSLLGIHLGDESFPVGKVDILTLHPMNFEEFLLACKQDEIVDLFRSLKKGHLLPSVLHEKLWGFLKHHFIVGGLPEVVASYLAKKEDLLSTFQEARNIQTNLYNGYLADMAKHSGKINAMHLDRVFKSVPEQLSRQQDGSAPKFKFKGIIPNISQFSRLATVIDWLEAAGLVHKVHIANSGMLPLRANTKDSAFKLFMFDIGMLGALANLSPKTILDYSYGTYKGFFAENFVLLELLSVNKGCVSAWHEATSELEFVMEVEGAAIPIEVKSGGNLRSRSLSVFQDKYKPPFSVKITSKELLIRDDVLIHNYPLYLASVVPLA